MILLLFLVLILLEASYEALQRSWKDMLKTLAGVLEFVYRAIIMLGLFAWIADIRPHELINLKDYSYLELLGSFVLLRFALFDACYNIITRQPVFYVGDTKIYDKMFRWFFTSTHIPKEHFLFMFKLIALCIGLSWAI